MSNIAHAREVLVARILEGDAKASHDQRCGASNNAGLTGALATLVETIAKQAHKITDLDIASAKVASTRIGSSSSPYVRPSGTRTASTTLRSRRSETKGTSMRLAVLDNGHRVGAKVFFALIRAITRLPVPDAIKLNRYRPEFYGRPMRNLTQEAMRGPSVWSVGDRELMGAFVSKQNGCDVCTTTHATVAAMAYRDEPRVAATLADLETAPIEEPLRATLRMLRKLTRDHTVEVDDMRALLASGVSREQIDDALAVCFTFNTVDRLSRTFGWVVEGRKAFETGARFLLRRGYG